MKPIYNLPAVIFLILIFSSCSTTIYLVRHAEKQNMTDTSSLTAFGKERAIVLTESLVNVGIDTIYATKYIRTQLTVQPLATALHQKIVIYSLESLGQFATKLKSLKGKKVLVVGHSNNIPKLINSITGESIQIADDDFDNFFEIKITRFLKTKTLLIKNTYGHVSPK